MIAASVQKRARSGRVGTEPRIIGPGSRDGVPRYDFRCRVCAETFEVTRPMSASGEPARCPAGHADTVKLLPAVAVGGLSAGRGMAPMAPMSGGGGGCCGGACGCG